MKHEIKFRAWNGEEMVSPDYIDRDGYAHWRENSVPTSTDKVMQYTGLKDKKGTEIYEGDILHFPVYNARGVVYWEEQYFYFGIRLVNRPPEKRQSGSLFDFITSIGWCERYEVVGNIYESKELLNVKADQP